MIAVDLLGGSPAEDILAGVELALTADPQLQITLVGAPLTALPSAVSFVEAAVVVPDSPDPLPAVRASRHASVRVAHRLVRDGLASACVTSAPRRVATAGAVFGLGLLPGVTEPGYGSQLGSSYYVESVLESGPGADLLAQQAIFGLAVAPVALGAVSGVAVLSEDAEVLSTLRHLLEPALVEPMGPHALSSTSAHSGHVLVSDPQTAALAREVAAAAVEDFVARVSPSLDEPARALLAAAASESADLQGPGIVLGVEGVSVCTAGAGADGIATGIRLAAALVEADAIADLRSRMAAHVQRRRRDAGLESE